VDVGELSFDLSTLGEENRPDPGTVYDLIIIGGGPAAMTAAVYAARKLVKLAVVTRDFGGQVGWTSDIENYLGFQIITGRELVEKFREQVEKFEVPVARDETVTVVKKQGNIFTIATAGVTDYRARTVILATGKKSRPLNVPGEQELLGKGVAVCATCDAPLFKGKKVVVAGGGNSAFTAALDLAKVAREVTVVNFTAGWQADEVMLETIRRYSHVDLLDNHQVVRIEGTKRVEAVLIKNRGSGEETRIPAEGIFIEIGLLPNSDPVKDLAELSGQGELVVDCGCRTGVGGLFGAGDVTTVPYKQIIISAGEGAKAALSAYEYLIRKNR